MPAVASGLTTGGEWGQAGTGGREKSALGTAAPARYPWRAGLGTAERGPCMSVGTGRLPLLTPCHFPIKLIQ